MIFKHNYINAFDFFCEGGFAGSLLREIDWSKTAVGPVDEWPVSLKNTVRMAQDNSSPMYIAWGEDCTQFYNDAYLPILGEEKFKDYMGTSGKNSFFELWPFIEPVLSEIKSGKSLRYEDFKFHFNRKGYLEECFFSFSASPLRDDFGNIAGVLVIANETTESVLSKRRLQEEREKLQLVADKLPAFVAYVGENGKYKFVNNAYSQWSGKNRSEIEGLSVKDLISDKATLDYMEPFYKKAFSGERVRYELLLSKPDGEYVIIDTEYLPDIDPETGKVKGILCVGQDITERKKAWMEAERAQKELREIFKQTPLPMAIMTGPNHVFTLANPHYVKFVGRDVLNKAVLDVFTLSEIQTFVHYLDKVYNTGESVLMRENCVRIPDENGGVKDLVINVEYHPYKDAHNFTVGVMAIIHDVTDQVIARKKVEESEERYRSLADTIPQLVWTSTTDGQINYANERCLKYTGTISQTNYGESWVKTIHPEDLHSVTRSWIKSIKSGKTFTQEYRIRRNDGVYRWFLGRSVPVKNSAGKVLYWNGTATDIEDQKRIERELEEAKENAENANATKSAFLANMSHEIRTPLGALLGFSELLKKGNIAPAIRDQYIDTISRNGQSLTRIIDDILDLAKVEAGKLDVEYINFSLMDLLGEVVALLKQKADQKDILLRLTADSNVPKYIYSDPTRLRQIFINIIGNAVKFTDIGSVFIHVNCKSDSEGKLQFSLSVTDTGRGLDEEQKNRLFKPFTQADNTTTRQYGGTGLGLALSKRLSEALGGTITIDKYEKDRGCTFLISFVATEGQISSDKSEKISEFFCPQKSLPLKGMQILFADDCPDNQFLIEHFLSINGASVSLASDGSEAVEKALSGSYDLVLMDIQMPKLDGYQAAEILMNTGYKTPILALTAHAMSEEREKTRAMGFSGHLTKPFNFNELLQTVAEYSHNKKPGTP
ncbi:MAG: PAS domain S-box protein [Bacteriovorax sp.]|jgi:PAS domain S-box-containing protein